MLYKQGFLAARLMTKKVDRCGEHGGDAGRPMPDELSDTWCKLLGLDVVDAHVNVDMAVMPILPVDDPWHELGQAQGAEVIDLQHVCLSDLQVSLTEQEVEQALQIIQEQPTSEKDQG